MSAENSPAEKHLSRPQKGSVAEVNLYAQQMKACQAAHEKGDAAGAAENLSKTAEHLRGWEHQFMSQLIVDSHPDHSPGSLRMETAPTPGVPYRFATLDPQNKRLAYACGDGSIRICSLKRGEENATPRVVQNPHIGMLFSAAFTQDGRFFAAGDERGNVAVFDARTWEETALLQDGDVPVRDLAISPDGLRVISEHRDGMMFWDVKKRSKIAKLVKRYTFLYPGSVQFLPKGDLAVVGGFYEVKVFDAATGQFVREMMHQPYAMSLSVSHDGTLVASGTRGSLPRSVAVFEIATGRQVFEASTHRKGISGVAFAPEDDRALSSSADGTLRFWHVSTGVEVFRINIGHPFGDVAFTNDRQLLTWQDRVGVHYIQKQ